MCFPYELISFEAVFKKNFGKSLKRDDKPWNLMKVYVFTLSRFEFYGNRSYFLWDKLILIIIDVILKQLWVAWIREMLRNWNLLVISDFNKLVNNKLVLFYYLCMPIYCLISCNWIGCSSGQLITINLTLVEKCHVFGE